MAQSRVRDKRGRAGQLKGHEEDGGRRKGEKNLEKSYGGTEWRLEGVT